MLNHVSVMLGCSPESHRVEGSSQQEPSIDLKS